MRPNSLDAMGYPLIFGSIGAPLFYIILGLALRQSSSFTLFDLPLMAVAFATAYGFSVVITGVFLLITLIFADRFALSRRATWGMAGAWPIALGMMVGVAYEERTGAMVFAMGISNYLLIVLLTKDRANSSVDQE